MTSPTPPPAPADDRKVALERAKKALRLVSANLPHLSGLTRLARIKTTRRVPVAAIGASGLVLVNPQVFAGASLADAAFVLAHELLHLALDSFARQGESDPLAVNIAHDYVINDILHEELERLPPLGGLFRAGARERSLERLVTDMRRRAETGTTRCWDPRKGGNRGSGPQPPMTRALLDAGLLPDEEPDPDPRDDLLRGDVIPWDREPEFEPELPPPPREILRDQARKAAAKAAGLGALRKKMQQLPPAGGDEPQRGSTMMQAVRGAYATPWQLALQHWMDAVAPGARTYAKPSRRGAERTDVVLPGRRREGWTLHVLLDTSGSMSDLLPKALGAMAGYCEGAGVGIVHIVQCDVEVTRDEWVEPERLDEYHISGFGYSDMSPGMRHFAEDPEVEAVLVLTDGGISYPAEEMPYRVLWVVMSDSGYFPDFTPPYGIVLQMPVSR